MSDPFALPENNNPLPAWMGGTAGNTSLYGGMSAWGNGAQDAAPAQDMTPFQSEYLELMGKQQQTPSAWQTGAQTFGSVAQGVGSLANVYMGLKNMKLQKKAFDFNKSITNTNMDNSIMDYNRRLGETLSNRALNNGQGQGWVSDQLSKYSAKRSG